MELNQAHSRPESGEIPTDWKQASLGDCAYVTKLAGFEYTHHFDYRRSGPVIAVRALNIKQGKLDLSEVHTLPRATSEALPRSKLAKGDLVMSYVGTLGSVAVVPEDGKFHLAPNVAKIRVARSHLDPYYLNQFLNCDLGQKEILGQAASTTQAALSMHNLRRVMVTLPPLPEQRAIAKVLSDVDALIQSLDRLIAKKRAIKKGAMQELLTGKRRLPGFSGEWEVESIGQFADCTAGGTPSTLNPDYWGGTIRWMSSGELNHKIIHEVEGRITEAGVKSSSTKILPAKCVLIGLAGQGKTRGTVALSMVELCTNQSIAAVLPNDGYVSEYLYSNLDSRYDELRGMSTGDGGRGGLNLRIIRNITVPLSSIPEQRAIAAVLCDMDAEIAALEQRRDKTRALKQGMMQELLTGRIRLV